MATWQHGDITATFILGHDIKGDMEQPALLPTSSISPVAVGCKTADASASPCMSSASALSSPCSSSSVVVAAAAVGSSATFLFPFIQAAWQVWATWRHERFGRHDDMKGLGDITGCCCSQKRGRSTKWYSCVTGIVPRCMLVGQRGYFVAVRSATYSTH